MSTTSADGAVPDPRRTVELNALRDLAVSAAFAAGTFLRDERPDDLTVESKSTPTDAVTAMDRGAEALLVDLLLAARPDDGVLGEEGGERLGRSGIRWILDPLDGTVNYLYGLPSWSVSVAAEIDGVAVVGVVHAPVTRETYVAVRGGGAARRDDDGEHTLWLDGPGATLDTALVGTGFGYDARRRAEQAAALARVLPRIRDVRRMGSAALDLCTVAAGRLDGYWERGLQPWDLAAGGLVVTEAGGWLGGLAGDPPGEAMTIAAHPGLASALHRLLLEAGAGG